MGVAYNSRIVTENLVLCLDAANTKSYPTKNFVSSKIYSSFGGSIRSSNYTVQYSDDNSNWTTAFTGVASNNTSCGIQQNTGSGSGSYGLHRYWRYVEGSPVQSHHPRVSRIILTDINGIDYNLVVYTSDNCSDTGTYQVGTVSLDFGGTTWTDLSGNGNTGTLVNGVGYSASNGGSLTFDGVDDYVRLANPPIQGTGSFTIISISKLTGGTQGRVVYAGGSDSTTGFYAHHYAFNPQAGTKWISAWGSAASASLSVQDYDLTSYHYAASVYNGSTHTTYTDGIQGTVASKNNSNLDNPSYWAIGSSGGNVGGNFFGGNISVVMVYNRALTAAEISQNYNALRGRFGL